jgi:hypothetical protein
VPTDIEKVLLKSERALDDLSEAHQRRMLATIRKLEKKIMDELNAIPDLFRTAKAREKLKLLQKFHKEVIKEFNLMYGAQVDSIIDDFGKVEAVLIEQLADLDIAKEFTATDREMMTMLKVQGRATLAQLGDRAAEDIAQAVYDGIIGGSKFLSLPQPVWTSVPTPYGCLVTESKAGAIGWNLVSASGSKQYSDVVCTTIRMAEAAYLHCQYLTAAFLNRRAFETMHPGESGEFFLSAKPENLDPVSCDALKRPILRMSPTVQPVASSPAAPSVNVGIACPHPAPTPVTPRPVTRKATPKPSAQACTNCCK